jgi:putative spermidine/putrescine transport system substrate-binding protein
MAKKRIAAVAALTGFGLLLTACSSGGASDDSLTVTMWGGGAQKAHVKSYFEPWAKEKGVKLKQDSPTDYAKLDAMVQAKKVNWGVVEAEPNFVETACADGKLEKLPEKVQKAAKDADVEEDQMNDCGIPVLQYTFSIAYNTDKFGDDHPKNWEEFFDTKKYPGKRAFWKYVTGGAFEAALLADGVKPEDLYPLDLDRAFKKLDTIKDDIVWYDTGDEQVQLVSSGEAPLVQAWNGRITQAAEEGQPVANEYNENLISYDQVVVPKGYPNKDLAMDWMEWFLSHPKAQADDAVASGYGTASPKALDELDEDVKKDLAGSDDVNDKSAGLIDYGYWAKNYDDVTEKFNVWVAK